jgi:hypothetical protein
MNFVQHEIVLAHANLRMEFIGDEERLALDLKVTFDLPNRSLDMLSPTLRRSLYDADDSVDLVDDDNTPNLRNPQLGTLKWAGKYSPVAFTFHDDDSDLRFADAKMDKILLHAQDGGTVSYTVRIQVYPEDSEVTASVVDLLHKPGVYGTLEASDEALQGDDNGSDDNE